MELVELPLAPAEAELAEIVIIGNNAGERCSIHRRPSRAPTATRRRTAATTTTTTLLLP